jgi:hypothetical protein
MKLVMTLLVRDEEDIIAANIDFHLAQGVDFIVAMDNLSVDCTPKILRDYERRGLLHYILQQEDNYMQHRWVTEMAQIALTRFGADWIINNDADEFWYPETGDLKQVLGAIPVEYDAVMVERINFLPRPIRPGDFFADVMTMRERTSVNALGQLLPGKVCHRGYLDIEVEQGNHNVSRNSQAVATTTAPITVLHFPIRTYRQFANKIALGGAAYARNTILPEGIGSTWRYLYELWMKDELKTYFQRQIDDTPRGIEEGKSVFDDRLKCFLSNLASQPGKRHKGNG